MFTDFLNADISVTAHTGCEKTPENSLESIDKAYQSNADIFEVDVWFDENGIPILTHDKPIGNEPFLEDAFIKLAEYKNMLCNLDIKRPDNLKEIVSLAKKHNVLDRVFYTGIFEEFVYAVKETPEIPYYLNLEILPPKKQSSEYLLSLVKKVTSCDAIGINCRYNNATAGLVEFFHENNLLVSLWTVNRQRSMSKVIALKPDNITTRYPSVLKKKI